MRRGGDAKAAPGVHDFPFLAHQAGVAGREQAHPVPDLEFALPDLSGGAFQHTQRLGALVELPGPVGADPQAGRAGHGGLGRPADLDDEVPPRMVELLDQRGDGIQG